MPDDQVLAKMYGPGYSATSAAGEGNDPRSHDRVLAWLASRPRGLFVDYGCGSGELLTGAATLGWEAIGVELDARVASATAAKVGVPVVTDPGRVPHGAADALHLGDVIEHLTRLDSQMPAILGLLKHGAFLLAQGPLEGNRSLFSTIVRLLRRARRRRTAEMAPYHVLLATATGQRSLFRRFGLEEQEYDVAEVFWPAPARLVSGDFARPRQVALFAVRRVSQRLSRLRPKDWGNRYFYVGRRGTQAPSG